MAGGVDSREHDLGQLLGIVLTMVQERVGIVVGGAVFMYLVPALVFIPAGLSAGFIMAVPREQLDFEKLAPVIMTAAVCTLVYIPLYFALRVGWMSICLKITRSEEARFSEFFSNFGYFLNFLAANIITSIAVTAGCCLLIIPGIFLGIKFCFAPLLVVDRNMGPIEAMKESWGMVEGIGWKLFLAYLCAIVANALVGWVPFLGMVGQLFVIAFIDLLITAIYREKKGDLVLSN